MSESQPEDTRPPPKKPRRQCHFDPAWVQLFQGIGKSTKGKSKLLSVHNKTDYLITNSIVGDTYAHCSLCCSDFSISHGGKNDVTTHVKGKHHKEAASAASSSQSVSTFFRPQFRHDVTEAEARWALFTVKHNLSFLSSDHASKLLKAMFPDSKIAKSFACGHTKTAAIIKEALSPHFQKKTTENLSNPFSIMLDESNDNVDKSCIILVRLLDPEVGNVCTRFLDMPVVNIGTAQNIFRALRVFREIWLGFF